MLYKFPDGNVSPAKDFTLNDFYYNQEIFYKLPLSELKKLGIKPFREETVPYGYLPGAYRDIETEDEWVRTYPNPIPDISGLKATIGDKIKTVRKSYEEAGFIFTDGDLKVFIDTDMKGSIRISQMQMLFAAAPEAQIDWQGVNPEDHSKALWFTMTAPRWAAIVQGGMFFVQSCFEKQKALSAELETISTVEELLEFEKSIYNGWPS